MSNGKVAGNFVGFVAFTSLSAVWAGMGSLAAFVTRNSAADKQDDWWVTALCGAVALALYLLAALFARFAWREARGATPADARAMRAEPARPGDRLVRVGRRLIGACVACLVFGQAVVALFFPERLGKGLTPDVLVILVPIWATGVVGLALLLAGWVRRATA